MKLREKRKRRIFSIFSVFFCCSWDNYQNKIFSGGIMKWVICEFSWFLTNHNTHELFSFKYYKHQPKMDFFVLFVIFTASKLSEINFNHVWFLWNLLTKSANGGGAIFWQNLFNKTPRIRIWTKNCFFSREPNFHKAAKNMMCCCYENNWRSSSRSNYVLT